MRSISTVVLRVAVACCLACGSDGISVDAAPVATIQVLPNTGSVGIGGVIELGAVLRDAGGNTLSGRTVTWTSSPSSVATVGGTTGRVTGVSVGAATITASAEGKSGTATITVTAPAPTLVTISPVLIDAVFASVPFSASGTNFMAPATVSVSGAAITATTATVVNGILITAALIVPGGIATANAQIAINTPGGTSNSVPLAVYGVGTAPSNVGTAIGGSGGTQYSIGCNLANEVATQLNVSGGDLIDAVSLSCRTVTGPTRAFGAPRPTEVAGGPGGSPASLVCPTGFVLTGVSGRTGFFNTNTVIGQITAICTPLAGGAKQTTGTVGANVAGSVAFSSECPPGLVVTGIQGSAGLVVDRIQLVCR